MSTETKYLFIWRKALRESSLPMAPKLVAYVLSDYMDVSTGLAYAVSVERLGRECSITPRRARGHISTLLAAGWLVVATDRKGGAGRAARYRASVPATRTPASALSPETRTVASAFDEENPDAGDTKPGRNRHKTRTPASAVLSSTQFLPPEPKRADLVRLVEEFAAAWVEHSAQTDTVANPDGLRRWVIAKHGAWARERFTTNPNYRPTQLVDMAKAKGLAS